MTTISKRAMWLLLPLIFTVWSSTAPATDLRIVVLIVVWLTGLFYAVPALAAPVYWLRMSPSLLWILWLTCLSAMILIWLLRFQPAVGIPLSITEQLWLVGNTIGLLLLPFAHYNRSENIPAMRWRAGLLTTLTTVLVIVIGLELGLRFAYVMSDNFQFSKMHQNWNRLYWNPINADGYRDYEAPPPDDQRTHILVLGDSLVTGYGVNHIDDTFPHILDAQLGADYTVNIAAQPGWGISNALDGAQVYPIEPDVVVLSHYINDIAEGIAAEAYDRPFPQIRVEPTEQQRWWTDRFYIANFWYYRVYSYTAHDSVSLYNDWIYDAYGNGEVWSNYQLELQSILDWTEEIDAPLVVVVWSNLLDIESSRRLTDPIVTFYSERDVLVVDMATLLADLPASQRTAN
ncbi:MAG: SGNH/GDSL hydrolase family protein, partial [Chloroflexota bacterium]